MCALLERQVVVIKQVVRSDNALRPAGAYSQGIILNGLLFTAGVGPIDPASGQVVGATIEEQTHQVMKNLGAILSSAGFSFSDAVKATVHLQDLARDFAGHDAATYNNPQVYPDGISIVIVAGQPVVLNK